MKLSQAIILVLIIIGILAILFCTRILYSFSNESFAPSKAVEGFRAGANRSCTGYKNCAVDEAELNNTHSLIPHNLPMDKPAYAKVGGYIRTGGDGLVPSHGKYQFVKPQLLYDAIWKEQINQIDGFAKNNWTMIPDGYACQERVYGTDKLFDIKNEPIDGMKEPVDGCANKERDVQLPVRGKCNFFPEPDIEDMLGYKIA